MKTTIAMFVLWAGLLAWMVYTPSSPFVDLGGDKVVPTKVKAGDVVTVTRNFRITREAPMAVTRTMVRGDCKASCEILDLAHGKLLLPPAEYRNVLRDQAIPTTAQPGVWQLIFTVQWEDSLGRDHNQKLAALEIEVVK